MTGRIVTIGEALGVLRTTEVGTLAHLSQLVLGTGGAEANVAIGASRLGTPSVFYGRVGDDSIGRRILRELRAESVDTRVHVDPDATTGILIKETPHRGRTAVTYFRSGSAGSRIAPADLASLDLAADDILHLSGVLAALSTTARDAIETALDAAETAGATISFDVNYRAGLWPAEQAAEVCRAIAARSAIVFAGEDEARILAGTGSGFDLARAIADLGPAEVVLKLGERGALAWVDGTEHRVEAVEIDAVDTVGAGDAFVAGYLSGRIDGLSVDERLAQAATCGAIACLNPGDWEGDAHRADLERFGASGDPVQR